MKILAQVITVQNESSRSLHMHAELRKLEPWCQAVVRQFDSPCADYTGQSDGNLCVQENLYQNHQRCAQHILESGAPCGLVLESDFKVKLDGKALARAMDAAVAWMENAPAIWDVLLLGGGVEAIDNDHQFSNPHVVRVRRYRFGAHALIYSREFCRQLVATEWPGSHFDVHWALHRQDVRMFMTRDMVIGVHHARHSREMAQKYWLARAMPMDFNASHWKIAIFTVFAVSVLSVLLVLYLCVSK